MRRHDGGERRGEGRPGARHCLEGCEPSSEFSRTDSSFCAESDLSIQRIAGAGSSEFCTKASSGIIAGSSSCVLEGGLGISCCFAKGGLAGKDVEAAGTGCGGACSH